MANFNHSLSIVFKSDKDKTRSALTYLLQSRIHRKSFRMYYRCSRYFQKGESIQSLNVPKKRGKGRNSWSEEGCSLSFMSAWCRYCSQLSLFQSRSFYSSFAPFCLLLIFFFLNCGVAVFADKIFMPRWNASPRFKLMVETTRTIKNNQSKESREGEGHHGEKI